MTDRFEIIPFHQHQILTVKTDDAVLVVMKPIVEALGLTWRTQHERITNHPVLSKGIRLTLIPSAGGMQESTSLQLEQFHGWLLTLDPRRVADDAKRDTIIAYQEQAFRVIFEHFHGKMGQPSHTAKSVSSIIATQNQVMKLIRRLQTATHQQERRALHQMLDGLCREISIDTPALDCLGSDAPDVSEILVEFWHAIDVLEARGHVLNRSRRSDLVALHMKSLKQIMADEKMNIRVDKELWMALEQSVSPRFLAKKPVNAKDGKVTHCWVFERNAG